MSKSRTRVILMLILIACFVVAIADPSLEQQIDDANKRLQDTKNNLSDVASKKNFIESQKSDLLRRLDDVQEKIRLAEKNIYELGEEIKILEKEILSKTEELAEAEQNVSYQNDRMKKRLRTLYKAGDLTYLEILMNSASLSDMMTQMDKIQILLEYDQDTLLALAEARNQIEIAKKELEVKNAELTDNKAAEENKRQELSSLETELKAVHAEYQTNYQALVELELAMEAEADSLTQTLSKLKAKRAYASGKMMWPVSPGWTRISSDFGERVHPVLGVRSFHSGIDIPAPGGSPIYAANSGVVIFAGRKGSYGNAVIVDHGGGIVTLYGHSSRILVNNGDTVQRGQTIAQVGSTGRSTGNHLHFEVRVNGKYVDPKPYLYSK